ncbi:MAG TPA: hypothetical protein VHK69_07155 [Chitinophagaceae bacterium]|jgi:hypothetical protein|nr:hypothetical protein [Chitinophagaceae bacterium]
MDLNNISLHPHLVAGLYTRTLVEALPAPPAPSSDMPSFRFLGSGKKGILVVVEEAELPFLTDASLQFLSSVLAACKLSIADVAIINHFHTAGQDYKEVLAHFHSRQILLFGVEPVRFGLPVQFPPFQLQAFDGATYLFAPPLPHIEQDKVLKGKLWAGLKTLFCL